MQGSLHYFGIYGRGEAFRTLLDHAKVKWEDKRLSPDAWPGMKPNPPYNGGGLPVWITP